MEEINYIRHLKTGKSPGPDNIPADILKAGSTNLKLAECLQVLYLERARAADH